MQSDGKKIIKMVGLSLFFLFIIIYAFFRSYDLLFGVKIKNVNIQNNAKYTESVLKINGNAKNATLLTLNGREIPIDKEGNFDDTIVLLSGYNIITLYAEDKFGNTDQKTYKLIYESNAESTIEESPPEDEPTDTPSSGKPQEELVNELEPAETTVEIQTEIQTEENQINNQNIIN